MGPIDLEEERSLGFSLYRRRIVPDLFRKFLLSPVVLRVYG